MVWVGGYLDVEVVVEVIDDSITPAVRTKGARYLLQGN